MKDWTFENLQDKADVIVIAEPTLTTNTGIVAPINGSIVANADGSHTQIFSVAIRTQFRVLAVLKGSTVKEFTLTLQKELPPKLPDGKLYASMCPYPYRAFDPSAHERYLIYLESVSTEGFDLLEGQGNLWATVIRLNGGP